MRGRWLWAGVLAALCAAASPVAGALLGLAGLTVALERRSPRALLDAGGSGGGGRAGAGGAVPGRRL